MDVVRRIDTKRYYESKTKSRTLDGKIGRSGILAKDHIVRRG